LPAIPSRQQQQQQQGELPATPSRQQQQQGGLPATPSRQQQAGGSVALVSPALRPGKAVVSQHKPGSVGVLRRLRDDGARADVAWPNQQRAKPVAVASLAVRPLPAKVPLVAPTAAGQRVVGCYGSSVRQQGTVSKLNGVRCSVDWDGGHSSCVEIAHVHALDADATGAVGAEQVRLLSVHLCFPCGEC
jgi:hypothetical protein